MKICAAQTRPIKGDIHRNIDNHKQFIDLAAANGAEIIIFPELSLTGYEPTLAQTLATNQEDGRFDTFQTLSNTHRLTIGVGAPTKHDTGICISMILFQPHKARNTYSKKYLHPDEEPFFISGQNFPTFTMNQTNVAPAICYELSIPEHAQQAYQSGAEIYIASVAKSMNGVANASQRLSDIARSYAMTILMSNCVGPSDDFVSAGKSSVWNHKGILPGQLDDTHEGILIYDTSTQEIEARIEQS